MSKDYSDISGIIKQMTVQTQYAYDKGYMQGYEEGRKEYEEKQKQGYFKCPYDDGEPHAQCMVCENEPCILKRKETINCSYAQKEVSEEFKQDVEDVKELLPCNHEWSEPVSCKVSYVEDFTPYSVMHKFQHCKKCGIVRVVLNKEVE